MLLDWQSRMLRRGRRERKRRASASIIQRIEHLGGAGPRPLKLRAFLDFATPRLESAWRTRRQKFGEHRFQFLLRNQMAEAVIAGVILQADHRCAGKMRNAARMPPIAPIQRVVIEREPGDDSPFGI